MLMGCGKHYTPHLQLVTYCTIVVLYNIVYYELCMFASLCLMFHGKVWSFRLISKICEILS